MPRKQICVTLPLPGSHPKPSAGHWEGLPLNHTLEPLPRLQEQPWDDMEYFYLFLWLDSVYHSLDSRIFYCVEFAVPVGHHLRMKCFSRAKILACFCSHRDEHVPGKEGANTKPVEDDVDKSEFVLWPVVHTFSLSSHLVSVILYGCIKTGSFTNVYLLQILLNKMIIIKRRAYV